MKIQPLADRIVLKPIEANTTSKAGIVIPDTIKEKPQEGEIVAVGPGRLDKEGKRVAMELKVGDRVLFSRYGGDEFKLDGEEYKILREDDVLGVVKTK